jgi:hypothetical protein
MDVVSVIETVPAVFLDFPQLDQLISFLRAEQKIAIVLLT